jgi:hypothetical protein
MEIIDDGEDIKYIEQPIGVISQIEEPYLEYDAKEDKNYLMVSGTIFSDYSKAAEILERRRTCKCSVEIAVEEMSYNVAEDYLSIDKFHFTGVTILGYQQDGTTEIQEGMAGSKITIDDFSVKHNSMFATNYQDRMIEILDKLNETLSNFNRNSGEKGDDKMEKFEELLAKYGVTAEEVTFETEGLSDEELEAKFAEMFDDEGDGDEGAGEGDGDDGDGEGAGDEGSGDEGTGEGEGEGTFESRKSYSTDDNGNVTITFEISHEDIRGALNSLITVYDEEDNDWYWVTNVYNDYFVFENWHGDKLFKQSYTVDGDNVALSGDRQEMFKMVLTESEKLAIEKMREDYSALVEFKANTEASQLQAQKDAVFAKEEFASIVETKSFKKLIENSKDYSVEECEQRAKDILEDFNSFAANFSAQDEVKKPKVLGFNFDKGNSKSKKPYGNLFADK